MAHAICGVGKVCEKKSVDKAINFTNKLPNGLPIIAPTSTNPLKCYIFYTSCIRLYFKNCSDSKKRHHKTHMWWNNYCLWSQSDLCMTFRKSIFLPNSSNIIYHLPSLNLHSRWSINHRLPNHFTSYLNKLVHGYKCFHSTTSMPNSLSHFKTLLMYYSSLKYNTRYSLIFSCFFYLNSWHKTSIILCHSLYVLYPWLGMPHKPINYYNIKMLCAGLWRSSIPTVIPCAFCHLSSSRIPPSHFQ